MSQEITGIYAARLRVPEGFEAVRKRPGMYVGSTGERGLRHLVFDVVERAANEALAGQGGRIDVTLTDDRGVRVADRGPGVPVEAAGHTDGPGLEDMLTRLRTYPRSLRGRHTLAMSALRTEPAVVNALSSRLRVEVRRGGGRWVQEYTRGVAVAPPALVGATTGSGTIITFWPDADIFETTQPSFTDLANRFREVAALNRDLTLSLTDESDRDESRSAVFRFSDEERDLVAALGMETGSRVHPDVIAFEEEDTRMAGTAEVSLRWCDSPEGSVLSFANSIRTYEGGTHETGLRDGVTAAVDAYAREHLLSTAAVPRLSFEHIGRGLTAVVSVKLDGPEFYGATRTRLGGDGDAVHPGVRDSGAVHAGVRDAVRAHLGAWLNRHPEQAAAVIGRIIERSHQH
ncbi:DNA gyrase subunit B [Streptomyces sp. NPDC058122]|uniref:DNA gyrase subunit B n=1 Tax=Streptomyces sp. NPDC058122 TaxID=3346349 RepID=UPI0036EF6C7E